MQRSTTKWKEWGDFSRAEGVNRLMKGDDGKYHSTTIFEHSTRFVDQRNNSLEIHKRTHAKVTEFALYYNGLPYALRDAISRHKSPWAIFANSDSVGMSFTSDKHELMACINLIDQYNSLDEIKQQICKYLDISPEIALDAKNEKLSDDLLIDKLRYDIAQLTEDNKLQAKTISTQSETIQELKEKIHHMQSGFDELEKSARTMKMFG